MNPHLLLGIISLLSGLSYLFHGQVQRSIAFFLLAGFFYWWIRYSEARAKRKPKKSDPLRYLWLGTLPLAIYTSLKGSNLVAQNHYYQWHLGLPLLLISGWAALETFPAFAKTLKTDNPPRSTPRDHSSWDNLLFLAPFSWAAMEYFLYNRNVKAGLLALGITALLFFLLRWHRRETQSAPVWKGEQKWLLIVLGIAALMRYPFVNHLFAGFQLDEAHDAISALQVLRGEVKSPLETGWGGSPTLPYFLEAVFVKIFGPHLFSYRLFTLTVSMLSTWVFYRWIRFYFSPRACLLATLLFGIAWWHVYYAFSPFNNNTTLLFAVCTFYFFEKGFREGKRADFWWAGIFTGMSIMTYIAGRLVPEMAFLSILGCVLFAGGIAFISAYGRHLALSVLAFFWLMAPFIRFVILWPNEFMGRARTMNIFNEISRSGDWWLPVRTSLWTMMSFFWTNPAGQGDRRFMIPGDSLLDHFTGLLVLAGFVLTLFTLNKRVSWSVIGGLVFGITANSLAVQCEDPPADYINPMRMFIIFPFVMFMAARALEWSFEIIDRAKKDAKMSAGILLGLGLCAAFTYNIATYYFRFQQRQDDWSVIGFHHVEQAKMYRQIKPECHLLLDNDSYSPIIEFMNGMTQTDVTLIQGNKLDLPIMGQVNRDVAVFCQPWKLVEVQAALPKVYPHMTRTEYRNPFNVVYVVMMRIPKTDIEAAQKGKTLGPLLP